MFISDTFIQCNRAVLFAYAKLVFANARVSGLFADFVS